MIFYESMYVYDYMLRNQTCICRDHFLYNKDLILLSFTHEWNDPRLVYHHQQLCLDAQNDPRLVQYSQLYLGAWNDPRLVYYHQQLCLDALNDARNDQLVKSHYVGLHVDYMILLGYQLRLLGHRQERENMWYVDCGVDFSFH